VLVVHFDKLIEDIGLSIDLAGAAVMVIGIVWAGTTAARQAFMKQGGVYRGLRERLSRAILLGLELLVAADIIRTVAAKPNLTSVAVLAGIVLIRTFLSFSLEVEVTGRWPWQNSPADDNPEKLKHEP
jgi:uncharacterized membrane protein